MKRIFTCSSVILIFVFGFVLGLDWPYYMPPDDWGVYSYDDTYKYVISTDETRLCKIVSIFNSNNDVAFYTDGYMSKGAHTGLCNVDVYWSPNSLDFFVEDSRGTTDVYIYDGDSWIGPYGLEFEKTSKEGCFLKYPGYDYSVQNILNGMVNYDTCIEYDLARIPDDLIKEKLKYLD